MQPPLTPPLGGPASYYLLALQRAGIPLPPIESPAGAPTVQDLQIGLLGAIWRGLIRPQLEREAKRFVRRAFGVRKPRRRRDQSRLSRSC